MSRPNVEYLSLRQAAAEYRGLLVENTMRTWIKRRTKGFDQIVTRAGRSVRIRRDRLEAFIGETRP